MICLCLVFVEVFMMWEGLRTLEVSKIIAYDTKTKKIKEKIVDAKRNEEYRKAAESRLAYYNKRYQYHFGSMMTYYVQGIKPEILQTWTGKYHRFLLILKMFVFEVLIVSLQTAPIVQLVLMSIIQLATLIMLLKGMFCDKIYTHKFFGIVDIFYEFTFMSYFSIGLMTAVAGREKIGKEFFETVQLYQIYLILFTAVLSMI